MLFDLRGRGRRRTVQVIYLGLAILIGAGLVLFGVGGAVSGGLFNAIDNSTTDSNSVFGKRAAAAAAQTRKDPTDAAAWASLARARYQLAGTGKNFDQNTSTFTADGKAELALVDQAWQKYLALDPKNPDPNLANLLVNAYGQDGLNKPDQVVQAYEIYMASKPPNANLYAQLAVFAYYANQTRKAELAEQKALALEPDKIKRAQLKQSIDQAKLQAVQSAAQSAGATTTATTLGG